MPENDPGPRHFSLLRMQLPFEQSHTKFSKYFEGRTARDQKIKLVGIKKKGGDNQIGHHLPGWGGVLLGKLKSLKSIIAFNNS